MIEQKSKFKQTEIGMIPEDWEKLKLSEAIDVNPKRELKKGVSAKKVSMDCLSPFNKKVKSFEISKFYGGSKFMNGDTIMARITPCLENGKTAFVDILSNNEVGFGSTEFIVLSGKNGKTNNDFVYYLSISPQLRKEAIKSMSGTSGRQRVQNDLFKEIELIIPPLQEQSAIAKILSDLDSKIELNQQMNKTLEAIGQAIFKHWFVDFEFPNENGEPYRSSGGEMVFNEELGKKIPKGWMIVKLKDIVQRLGPGTNFQPQRVDEGIPFLNVKNISDGFLDLRNIKYISNEDFAWVHKSWKPEEHDVLISRIGTLGNIAIIRKSDLPISVHYNIIDIKPKDTSHAFLYFLFISDIFQTEFHLKKVQTVQEYITIENVENIKVALPANDNLKKFDSFLLDLVNKLELNYTENQTLSQIRDSLLPKLMSGKIRVPVEVRT